MSRNNDCDVSDGSSYVIVDNDDDGDDGNLSSSSSSDESSSYVHVSSGISLDLSTMALDDDDDDSGDHAAATRPPVKIRNCNDDDKRRNCSIQTNYEKGFDGEEEQSNSTKSSLIEDKSNIQTPRKSSNWLVYEGTYQQAISTAKHQKKLLLVSLQQDPNSHILESFAISNPDIQTGIDQFTSLIDERYIFVQLYAKTKEGDDYSTKYYIDKFPHIGVLHPIHQTMIWGIDGPPCWDVNRVLEGLVDCGCVNYTREHFGRIEEAGGSSMATKNNNTSRVNCYKQMTKPVVLKKLRRKTPAKKRKKIKPSSSSSRTASRHIDNNNITIDEINNATTEELYMIQQAIIDINLDEPMEVARFFQLQSSLIQN